MSFPTCQSLLQASSSPLIFTVTLQYKYYFFCFTVKKSGAQCIVLKVEREGLDSILPDSEPYCQQ